MAGLMSLPTWNVSGLDVLPFGSTTESRFGSAKANVRAHDGWPTRPVIGNRRLTPVHLVVGLGLYRGRMCQPPRPGNGKDNGHDSDQDNFRDSDVDALQQKSWCCTLSLRRRHRRPDNGSLTHLRRFLLQGTFLWQLGVAVLSVQSPKMAWGCRACITLTLYQRKGLLHPQQHRQQSPSQLQVTLALMVLDDFDIFEMVWNRACKLVWEGQASQVLFFPFLFPDVVVVIPPPAQLHSTAELACLLQSVLHHQIE